MFGGTGPAVLAVGASFLGALLFGACGPKAPDLPGPKHIVLISLDTVRADHLGAYGDRRKLTPTIDALAAQGMVFDQVLAPAPTTLASHTSMLTGSYPQTHGVVRNGFPVHPDNVTLAEVLRGKGFHTAAFLGSFALDARFGLDQGFELYEQSFDTLVAPGRDQNQRSAEAVTDAVLQHLDELGQEPDRTFFFVHYFDAHLPYEPPLKWARRLSSDGETMRFDATSIDAIVQAKQRAQFGLEPTSPGFGMGGAIGHGLAAETLARADGRPIREEALPASLYAAEIAAVDEQIARLMVALERNGWLADTLIILTGDHGETFWEHGDIWNHGLWVYQTTTSVPMIWEWAGAPWKPGSRIPSPASTVDVVPTLLEMLGLPSPERVDGVSWLPAFGGGTVDRGPVFSVATQPYSPLVERPDLIWRNALKPHAIRLGPWKYIQSEYNGVEELFQLDQDPGERKNRIAEAASDPEVANVLQDLRTRLQAFRASAHPLPSQFDPSQAREAQSRLKAMGY